MFVSAFKKTLAHSWSFSLIASGNWTQPHVRSNHNSPGRNNLRTHYGCLTHNCQASQELLNLSVPTWGSLSLFWIRFDSSSLLLNHSALTVASSFFLSPFTLHQTALFGSLSFAVQGGDYSFVVMSILGRACCSPRDDDEGCGPCIFHLRSLGLPAVVALMSSLAKDLSHLDRCGL